MSKENLNTRLAKIQETLNAPKNQRNSFGNYNYRSCEDILEALKPLLKGLTVTLDDDIVLRGDAVSSRIYVKATATISDGTDSITASSFAREPEKQKGMSDAQLTGATSSYARKYALNGLFLIDDNKDADTDEAKGGKKAAPKKPVTASSGNDDFRRKKVATENKSDDDDI